jgi:hypothetical protein
MRQFGKMEIPQEAFIAALKMDADRGTAQDCIERRRESKHVCHQVRVG